MMQKPMRKTEREIKDAQEIAALLARGQVVQVAMCQDDQPYVLSFNYGYLRERLYIHSATEGLKLDILRANPKVSFQLLLDYVLVPGEKPWNCTVHYQSVVGFGRARMVDDPDEKLAGIRAVMAQHDWDPSAELPEKIVNACSVWCIEVESMTGKRHG